jgi:upstream activation factor subunit UAF30
VSADEEAQYTSIIDAILASADLATVSRKKIRLGLEKALGGKDLSAQKVQIPYGSRYVASIVHPFS